MLFAARDDREAGFEPEFGHDAAREAKSRGHGQPRTAPMGDRPGKTRQPDRATVPNTMSSGRTGTRLSSRPVAARIAATIAGVLEIVGGSPTPFAPYGASGCGCSITSATTGGMSSAVGSR